jgi:uncharacterized SAM-binding protein YcdF (DUF218 family)
MSGIFLPNHWRSKTIFGVCSLLFGCFLWFVDWPKTAPDDTGEVADLILILGGGAEERPREAWRLYEAKKAPKVLVTGDGYIITSHLARLGLPKNALLHELNAKSTLENALFSRPILEQHRIKSVLLVTTWSHMPRALAVFRSMMPNVRFIPSSEPKPKEMNQWHTGLQRRERFACLYFLFSHGFWCF